MASSWSDDGIKKKSKADEADLDITPMIDVTFLLLIFFMVTSTMQQQAQTNVPPAKHGVGKDGATSTFITVLADKGGGPPRIMLGDGADGDEARSADQIKAWVQEGIAEGKNTVIVKADRDVYYGKVQEVLKALRDMEDLQFAVGIQDPR